MSVVYLCRREPILPAVLCWKVLLPGIGPSIYQPSPNVTMQIFGQCLSKYTIPKYSHERHWQHSIQPLEQRQSQGMQYAWSVLSSGSSDKRFHAICELKHTERK